MNVSFIMIFIEFVSTLHALLVGKYAIIWKDFIFLFLFLIPFQIKVKKNKNCVLIFSSFIFFSFLLFYFFCCFFFFNIKVHARNNVKFWASSKYLALCPNKRNCFFIFESKKKEGRIHICTKSLLLNPNDRRGDSIVVSMFSYIVEQPWTPTQGTR